MSRLGLRLILAATVFGSVATAQTNSSAFEVASVKPSTSGYNGIRGGCRGIDTKSGSTDAVLPLGRCVITDARLIQEQLGLRLESRKILVSYFVIDSAERPGAN